MRSDAETQRLLDYHKTAARDCGRDYHLRQFHKCQAKIIQAKLHKNETPRWVQAVWTELAHLSRRRRHFPPRR